MLSRVEQDVAINLIIWLNLRISKIGAGRITRWVCEEYGLWV